MRFESMTELFAMGGHGPFVWSAYAIAFVVIVFNFVWPVIQARRNIAQLRAGLVVTQQVTQKGDRESL